MALEREAELLLEHNYLRFHDESQQPNDYINADMRRLTVGWMGEVVREFGLSQETLFGACRLLDRFLSCSRVRGQTRTMTKNPKLTAADPRRCTAVHLWAGLVGGRRMRNGWPRASEGVGRWA